MSRYDGYDAWDPYVSVAERRRRALKEMNRLKKKGKKIEPVEIGARKPIAKSFWGKGWCNHVESLGDMSNRLPRGRRYARNGSVCHLGIEKGEVGAFVYGSDLYEVEVHVVPLKATKWKALQIKCRGGIGSLIALLQGQLSPELMEVVTDRKHGLFPSSREITYTCNCPDYASMCKHVAAVIYGIGARLDSQPELLFLLRGVDHAELAESGAAVDAVKDATSQSSRRRKLVGGDLGDVFGVDLDEESAPAQPRKRARKAKGKSKSKAAKKVADVKKKVAKPVARNARKWQSTGKAVAALRAHLGMTQREFAETVGVSIPSIANWERQLGPLGLHDRSRESLERVFREAGQPKL